MQESIKLLLHTFQKRSFYVLGAGASAGIVPMATQLNEKIITPFLDFGVFSTDSVKKDERTERIVNYYRNTRNLNTLSEKSGYFPWFVQEILDSLSPGFVVARSFYELSVGRTQLEGNGIKCSNYDVFQLVARPPIFFNMNLDNLARDTLNKYHIVLQPHGGYGSVANVLYEQQKLYVAPQNYSIF